MISGDEDESARSRAKQLGATDFITKGIGTAELLSRLETLVKLSKTNEALEKSSADAALDPVTGLLSRKMLLRNCDQQFSYAQRHQVEMSVLVVGIDRYEERVLKHGPELAEEFLAKFAELLQASVRTEDVLATFGSNQFAIVSAGTQVKAASLFALRLCEAVAAATISHRSRPLRLTVSIGIANSAADTVAEATALLTLAETRMYQAMQAGGNRILGVGGVPVSRRREEDGPRDIDHALARLAVGDVDSVRLQLATLTDRLMPFLRLIEYDYGVALPLAELERIIASNKASE
jgi:diguanylate cyclase (GGDEF)-like protein